MKNSFVIEYLNENEFRKKERAVKKTQKCPCHFDKNVI